MENYNIVLIGLGGFGFRHFQALMNLNLKSNITIVDLDNNKLEKAKEYFQSMSNQKITIRCIQDIECYTDDTDLAIISTSSKNRRKVIEQLINVVKVKYMILEKVLFPCLDDYFFIDGLLYKQEVLAWVNCPRRMYCAYEDLRKLTIECKNVNVAISGSNWGLGCNAIHMIDFIDFISGERDGDILCDGSLLDNMIIDSKRSGYIEFTGMLLGSLGSSVSYLIESTISGESSRKINIFADQHMFVLDESNNFLYDGSKYHNIVLPFQSKLTNVVAEDLLINGTCKLTPYKRSMNLHLPLVKAFLKKYNESKNEKKEGLLCPIT